ncbi:MAG: hypothetical protein H7X95_00815 [Deltaproteobacteria bacterium]|nr:hypothetical protein [Deltaproteobacteria bacterium]
MQESPSLGQVVGQVDAGSHVSLACTWPSPQEGAQSLSVWPSHPVGQQRSPPPQAVIGTCEHARVQLSALPRVKSWVHGSASAQEAEQAPGCPAVMPRSQVSVSSTMPFPQRGAQSLSLTALQLGPQQRSPFTQEVTGCRVHRTSQSVVAVRFQVAHAAAGGHDGAHDKGTVPVSHDSHGVSTTPFPQVAGQSASMPA